MNQTEIAVFGGGCFWCTEAVFAELVGVKTVMPGYAGGKKEAPTYEEVSSGKTGHAESVQITFDPAKITFEDLLSVFFATHDPTTPNRQGNDIGEQYRSVIFYTTDVQKKAAEQIVRESNEQNVYGRPIVTQVLPLDKFYPAEDYHREYYKNHADAPYCQIVIEPKLEKLRTRFNTLVRRPASQN